MSYLSEINIESEKLKSVSKEELLTALVISQNTLQVLEDSLRASHILRSGYYTLASSRAKQGDPIWDAILRAKERVGE